MALAAYMVSCMKSLAGPNRTKKNIYTLIMSEAAWKYGNSNFTAIIAISVPSLMMSV